MGKRTVKAKLNTNKPDTFLKLCEDVVTYNNTLGATSPFADGEFVNMTDYADKVSRARQKREEALEHYAIAEAAMFESRKIIGRAPGQSSNTEGTLFNLTASLKKILLVLNRTNPEALSLWGFDVVVGIAKNPGRRKKK